MKNFSKDLWSDGSSLAYQRSLIVGFSQLGRICTDRRYSLVEEVGGLISVLVITCFLAKY